MKHKSLLIGSICVVFLLSIFIYITYHLGLIQPLEEQLYQFLSSISTLPLTYFMKGVSFIIDPLPLVIICLSLFIFPFTRRYYAFPIAVGTLGATLINIGLKNIIKRPRPEVTQLVSESGYSLPSSHSAASTAFFLLIILISRRTIQRRWLKNLITIVSILLIPCVALSRIYLGVHHLGDVLIGACLGFIIGAITYIIYDNYYLKSKINQ